MSASQVRGVLRVDALFEVVAGLLLLSGTWDGLYDFLDLPQAKPALLVQIGGAGILAPAYLLWVAPDRPALVRLIAGTTAAANALAALIIAIWLIFEDLGIGTGGTVLLAAAAAVLAIFALLEWRIAS